MKPIYDFFKENNDKMENFYKGVNKHMEEHPDDNRWDVIEKTKPDEVLVMNTLIPHDEEYDRIEKSGKFLLNPQTEFYGTKWDFTIEGCNLNNVDEECITLAPSTAWSPPDKFCERLAKKYNVNITLQYEEGGVGFVGKEVYTNEGMVEQEFYENYYEGLYRLDIDTFWSMVESELENIEEDTTEEEFLKQFPYVGDADRKQLQQEFQEYQKQI